MVVIASEVLMDTGDGADMYSASKIHVCSLSDVCSQ